MKTLYLVRHAEAVGRDPSTPDAERPLSERGQRQARAMAAYASSHGPPPDLIISSPAPRAFETARAFAQRYHYPVARIRTYPNLYTGAEPGALVQLVQGMDDAAQTAMVIGHNPLCRDSARHLAPMFRQDMAPGAVACLQLHAPSWAEAAPGRGVAVWAHDPGRKPDDPAPASPIDALQKPEALIFQPASPLDAKALLTDLQTLYTARKERTTERRAAYFDTFDWRLYKQSLTLQWEAPQLRLHRLDDNALLACETLPTPPRSADALPTGALRQRLEKTLDIRALLPLFESVSQDVAWRLLNADDKTVVRLVIERHACDAQGRPAAFERLCLKPLKGYAPEAEQAQQWLLARGFMPSRAPFYALALAALGITPNAYNAKLPPLSDPKMRTDAALRSILRFSFGVMRQNEAGVLDDIDTEFLHDFRVASRRARSAVGQFKDVFDPATTERLRRDLASIGAMTNRVRDLDVYLLRRADYCAKLPEAQQAAIEPLFERLQQDRKQAFNTLKRKLRAKTYADLMRRWETFLDAEPAAAAGRNAARPIGKVAQKRLAKLAGRVLEDGHGLLANEDDERLHELRIDCKKLRYVLEFTSDLFPAPAVAPATRRLRKLQDVLGDFHDLQVQQESLESYAEHFQDDTQQAIAHLINVLETEKQARKAAFAKQFRAFAASLDEKRRPWKRKGKRAEGKQHV